MYRDSDAPQTHMIGRADIHISPAIAISEALDRISIQVYELECILLELRGAPCNPIERGEDSKTAPLAELLQTTPKSIDSFGERLNAFRNELREILL
jgi:hypothetical protein